MVAPMPVLELASALPWPIGGAPTSTTIARAGDGQVGEPTRSFMEMAGTELGLPGVARAEVDVVVVDDDESVRTSMTAVLESADFEVLAAGDGQAAMDLLTRTGARVLVLDLMMVPRDGLWLLEQLQARPDLAPPVVIVVSAFALNNRDEVLARFPGIVAHAMQKPVAPAVLIDVVARALDDLG